MVEQQRRAIVQTAQVGRIGLMAQDLVAEVTRNGELRAEWELIGAILHLVEGGQLSSLILALKAAVLAVASGFLKHDRAEVMLSQPVARLGWAVPRAVEPDCLDLAFAFLDAVDEVNPRTAFIVDAPQRIVLIRIGQSCRVLIRIGARKIHSASVF